MKFRFLFSLLIILALASCGKKNNPTPQNPSTPAGDTTPPVLTLNGKSVDTCYLQSPYTDPGATATDNNDGNLSPWIVVTGSVNTSQGGNHTLNYHVKDAAGNQAPVLIRTVHVVNSAYFMEGNYAVSCTCTIISSNPTSTVTQDAYTVSATASSSMNKQVDLNILNVGVTKTKAYVGINGNSLGISYSVAGHIPSSGFGVGNKGTLSTSGTSFTLQSECQTMPPSDFVTYTCKNVFQKL